MPTRELADLLIEALHDGLFTGAAVCILTEADELFHETVGYTDPYSREPVHAHTLFDLASLTKILAVTACRMIVHARRPGLIDEPLGRIADDCPPDKREITVRMLLAHSSGLPAWRPYYLYQEHDADRADAVIRRILGERLEYRPGTGCTYSDLGFILLGRLMEMRSGHSLPELTVRGVIEPLGLTEELLFSRDLLKSATSRGSVAMTRVGEPAGLVHDLNARALGGAAGHAGLFGTARAVALFGREILKGLHGSDGIFDSSTVRSFCTRAGFTPDSSRALGLDTPGAGNASCGRFFSPDSVGHTGFTGTSLWIDPHAHTVVSLLTNRVIMGEHDFRITEFRRRYHEAVSVVIAAMCG